MFCVSRGLRVIALHWEECWHGEHHSWKALAGGSQSGFPCFRNCLPPFCLYLEVPQGCNYKALTTKKQNPGLRRHIALACFLGPSDAVLQVGGGFLLEEVGHNPIESKLPQRLFLPPFFMTSARTQCYYFKDRRRGHRFPFDLCQKENKEQLNHTSSGTLHGNKNIHPHVR